MRYESIATARVLEWFDSQGLTNYEYIDSAVVLPPAPHLKRVRDPEIIMALCGNILRARRHIKRVAYWNIVGDTSTEMPNSKAVRARIRMMYICARRNDITIERPLETWTKQDVIRAMPRELFELAFWCRQPLEGGVPCRKCKTCVDVYRDADLVNEVTADCEPVNLDKYEDVLIDHFIENVEEDPRSPEDSDWFEPEVIELILGPGDNGDDESDLPWREIIFSIIRKIESACKRIFGFIFKFRR
jgi:hypothetical protein